MIYRLHYLLFPFLFTSIDISQAAIVTLDFEDLSGMPHVYPGFIPDESRLSDQYLGEFGVLFNSGSPYVAVTNISTAATSGVNGIFATLDNGGRTNTVPINVSFFKPGDPTVPYATTYVSARTDRWGTHGLYSATLNAYDVMGSLLGSVTVPDSNGQLLSFSAQGIHSFELTSTAPDYSAIAFDDVAFETTSVVPIPAPLWLFATGLAGTGLVTRSRRKIT